MKEQITQLIQKSYSPEEALKYKTYQTSLEDINTITENAKALLKEHSSKTYSCAPMSALWSATIRDNYPAIQTYMVAGSLHFRGRKIFGGSNEESYYEKVFVGINPNWDGHCWIVVGDYIGDISLLCTAR